jgi:hypothetical protein
MSIQRASELLERWGQANAEFDAFVSQYIAFTSTAHGDVPPTPKVKPITVDVANEMMRRKDEVDVLWRRFREEPKD